MVTFLRKEPAVAAQAVTALVAVAAAIAKDRWDIDVDPVAAAGFLLALLGVSTVTIRSVVSSPATVDAVKAEANEQGAQYAYAAAKAEAADQVLNAPHADPTPTAEQLEWFRNVLERAKATDDYQATGTTWDLPPAPPPTARVDPPAPPSVGLWPGQAPPRWGGPGAVD